MGNAGETNLWNTFDEKLSAIPGGTSLHPAVLRSMQRPYVNPWSSEFVAYFEETLALLKRLYNTRQDVLVMIGPIRMAMDAVVCSLLEPGEKAAAVAVNGHWSELFTHIARAHGAVPIAIEVPWGLPIDPDKVRRQFDAMRHEDIKALFITHVETSTGVLNPVEELGKVAQERGLLYVVDAAQALGGIEVRMDDWGIDFCLGGNHKCMSTPAGLTYMGISERGWQALERRQTPIQAWYTNLLVWREVWMKRQSGYFTFPSSLVFGLRAALDQMFDMSLPVLYRRYTLVAKAIRYAVSEMGLELVVSGHDCPGCDSTGRFCADTATAIRYPPNVRHEDFAQLMHSQYNISIAGTYGPFAGKAFRVGPTGLLQIGRGFTLNLLSCMGMAFQQLGFPANVDRVLSVADAILAEL
jgi:alanine-glyoxylate transaminase/serine-glyoxylate transaminase/serine-pyruvate transaminase